MFGQSALDPVWVRGAGVVGPPVDGCVVAFGAADADGSAADTTATPPTTSNPTASSDVATSRRTPPSAGCAPEARAASGGCGAGWLAG
jgi:hypothetical protein